MSYNRNLGVQYALKWALNRNQQYYNYDKLGGDCTNFISQCLFAGIEQMNYRKNGWFYKSANIKSPSWAGVEFLYHFLINNKNEGPKGKIISINELQIGDLIQLSFDGNIYGHTLIATNIDNSDVDNIIKNRQLQPNNILVCAHSIDAKNRNLSSYIFQKARFIHIF